LWLMPPVIVFSAILVSASLDRV